MNTYVTLDPHEAAEAAIYATLEEEWLAKQELLLECDQDVLVNQFCCAECLRLRTDYLLGADK